MQVQPATHPHARLGTTKPRPQRSEKLVRRVSSVSGVIRTSPHVCCCELGFSPASLTPLPRPGSLPAACDHPSMRWSRAIAACLLGATAAAAAAAAAAPRVEVSLFGEALCPYT